MLLAAEFAAVGGIGARFHYPEGGMARLQNQCWRVSDHFDRTRAIDAAWRHEFAANPRLVASLAAHASMSCRYRTQVRALGLGIPMGGQF